MQKAETIAKVMQDVSAEAATIIDEMTIDLVFEAAIYRLELRTEGKVSHSAEPINTAKPDNTLDANTRFLESLDSKTARILRYAGNLSSSHGFIL